MREIARFDPFATHLDEAAALAVLKDAVAGADDGELYLERRRSEILSFDDGRLKTASYDTDQGFGLRTVLGGAAGYAHASELSESALKRAAETARMAARDGGGVLAPPPPGTNRQLYAPVDPVGDEDLAVKIGVLREIDDWLRARDPRVVQVSATLSASVQEIEILRPEGGRVTDHRPLARLNIAVIVEKDGRRETGSSGGGGRHDMARLITTDAWRAQAEEALRVAAGQPRSRGRTRRCHGSGAGIGLARHPAARGDRPWAGGRLQPQGHIGLHRTDGQAHRRPWRHRGRRRHHPGPARQPDHRRRGHTHRPHHPDRGRRADRLHAGPPERPPDGRRPDRQRAPRKLRPHPHAAHDQHDHGIGRRRTLRMWSPR